MGGLSREVRDLSKMILLLLCRKQALWKQGQKEGDFRRLLQSYNDLSSGQVRDNGTWTRLRSGGGEKYVMGGRI